MQIVTNKNWQFAFNLGSVSGTLIAIYSNVLYTVLEIGLVRAKNGVFMDFVCHDTGTKMSPSLAQISGKRAAILNNIT